MDSNGLLGLEFLEHLIYWLLLLERRKTLRIQFQCSRLRLVLRFLWWWGLLSTVLPMLGCANELTRYTTCIAYSLPVFVLRYVRRLPACPLHPWCPHVLSTSHRHTSTSLFSFPFFLHPFFPSVHCNQERSLKCCLLRVSVYSLWRRYG